MTWLVPRLDTSAAGPASGGRTCPYVVPVLVTFAWKPLPGGPETGVEGDLDAPGRDGERAAGRAGHGRIARWTWRSR